MLVKNSFEFDARVTKEARSLIDAGHEVRVVAIHARARTERFERRADGIEVHRVPRLYGRSARLAGPTTNVPGGRQTSGALRQLLRPAMPFARAANTIWLNMSFVRHAVEMSPDVVHAHDLNTLIPGLIAAFRTGARLVYDAHELAVERNERGEAHRLLARVQERRCLRQVDAVVTTNDTWADYLVGVYQIARPIVVRNIPERPSGLEEAPDLRALLGVSRHETVVLYQGSVQPNRGIEQAMDALARLDQGILVILGYGAHVPALRRRADVMGLTHRVHFVGPVANENLHAWTRQADVGLCTIINSSLSYYWSLPNKLFEYLQAGIPQVTSDFPEMGPLVRQLGIGETCDPADPRRIAEALTLVLAVPQPYRDAARVAARHLHWGGEREALLGLYRRLERSEASETA